MIKEYRFELVEDFHSFGSGRYGGKLLLPVDISPSFPYLNTLLDDSIYDHDNRVLIGTYNRRRYAFRPHEIQIGTIGDASAASPVADEVVGLVNRVWNERESITPSTRERKLPAAFDIYRLLPGTNCRECGCPTCLAFAGDLRDGVISLERCPLLQKSEYAECKERIRNLFNAGSA